MRKPDKYKAQEIKNWDTTSQTDKGNWEPSRPAHRSFMYPWYWRFSRAWGVFVGKADALYWHTDPVNYKINKKGWI